MSGEAPQRRTPTPGHGADLMSTPSLFALAVVAFAVELALFGGVGAIAYELALFGGVGAIAYELVDGGLGGWLAAAAATAGILVFWGVFMAPKGRWRLATTPRLVVSAVLCLGTAYGLIQLGHPWWGWFVGIAGIAVVAAQAALPQAGPDPA